MSLIFQHIHVHVQLRFDRAEGAHGPNIMIGHMIIKFFFLCSNVVEKCVSYSSRAEKAMLIEEVCALTDG